MNFNIRKTILSAIFAVAVVTSLVLPTFAANGGKTTSNVPTVKAGETAIITIKLENCDEVLAGGLSIDSMSDDLELVNRDTKWMLEDPLVKDVDYGKLHAVFAYLQDSDVNGDLFRIGVKVSDTASLGKKNIEYEFKFKNQNKDDFSVSGKAYVEVVGANGERASGCGAFVQASCTAVAISVIGAAMLLKKNKETR